MRDNYVFSQGDVYDKTLPDLLIVSRSLWFEDWNKVFSILLCSSKLLQKYPDSTKSTDGGYLFIISTYINQILSVNDHNIKINFPFYKKYEKKLNNQIVILG